MVSPITIFLNAGREKETRLVRIGRIADDRPQRSKITECSSKKMYQIYIFNRLLQGPVERIRTEECKDKEENDYQILGSTTKHHCAEAVPRSEKFRRSGL